MVCDKHVWGSVPVKKFSTKIDSKISRYSSSDSDIDEFGKRIYENEQILAVDWTVVWCTRST